MIDQQFLRRLRLLGRLEGVSSLILFFIAMPLKYAAGLPIAVRVVGSLHGFLFVCLVTMLLVAIKKVPIQASLAAKGIVAAVFPFGPFVIDHHFEQVAKGDGA